MKKSEEKNLGKFGEIWGKKNFFGEKFGKISSAKNGKKKFQNLKFQIFEFQNFWRKIGEKKKESKKFFFLRFFKI